MRYVLSFRKKGTKRWLRYYKNSFKTRRELEADKRNKQRKTQNWEFKIRPVKY